MTKKPRASPLDLSGEDHRRIRDPTESKRVEIACLDGGVRMKMSSLESSTALEVDIVVIGAGGAGLAAAIEAVEKRYEVIVLEKMPKIGGNTIISSGWISAAGTELQKKQGIQDSPDNHFLDTLKGGDCKNNAELVRIMVDNAADAINWMRSLGVRFDSEVRWGKGTLSNKRAHVCSGAQLIKVFKTVAEKNGAKILTGERVIKLVTNRSGCVIGVMVESNNEEIFSITARKAVIITTGGFGANAEMIAKCDFRLKYAGTTNFSGATGDGIMVAQAIGANCVDMEYIQTYPLCNPKTGRLSRVAERGVILVNREGERFVAESGRRDVRSRAILAQRGGSAFSIFDEENRGEAKVGAQIISGATPMELARKMGIHGKKLKKTIDRFNSYIDVDKDPEFGTRLDGLKKIKKPLFYAVEVVPSVHYTGGGLTIDVRTQVLDVGGRVIPGLYAAGEVVGGIDGTNRLGGNALCAAIVFGRIAGANAATENKCQSSSPR